MRVTNYHAEKGVKGVWIMRPAALGNPFKIGRDGTRLQVIAKFERHARADARMKYLISQLREDDILICCCKPAACHGDVIVKLWEELREGRLV